MTLAADQGLSRSRPAASPPDRAVAIWLLACCAMIFAMVVIGGVTRLTESGLSIMEWAPLMGALPPLSDAEWQRVFDLYRAIPQYGAVNAGMDLAAFKGIFWWEWTHRLWGRLIGVVFLLPFLWFLIRRRIPEGLAPHLAVLFLLGGLQGFLGWYMVSSGFAGRVSVSQYRLVVHLALALAIYGYMLWLAFGLLRPATAPGALALAASLRRGVAALLGLAAVTMALGGFTAGLDGGLLYNTFPLMNGRLLPEEFLATSPAWLDPFENPATAQLVHRWLAVALAVASLALWAGSRRQALAAEARRALDLVALMTLVQLGLGVATLLLAVPIPLAALHQAGAVILLSLLLWALHRLRPATAPS